METLILSHEVDVEKKEEENCKPGYDAPLENEETDLSIKVKQEHVIKEEVDIPWDETIYDVERGDLTTRSRHQIHNVAGMQIRLAMSIDLKVTHGDDDVCSSEKYCNQQLIVDKPDTNDMNENISESADPNVKYNYQVFLKICTTCNKRYKIIPPISEIKDCKQCKTRLIYDYKNCLDAVQYTTITLQMNYQRREPKHKCSKCGEKFEYLTKFLKHIQICTGSMSTSDSRDVDESQIVREQVIVYCGKCDYELKYADYITSKNNINRTKIIKINNDECFLCKSAVIYKCAECKRIFKSQRNMDDHIRVNHGIGQEYKCSECDYKSRSFRRLAEHYTRHLSRRNVSKFHGCPNCRELQRNKTCLKKHLRLCKSKDYCKSSSREAELRKRSTLQLHEKTEDIFIAAPKKCSQIESHYECDHCLFKFSTKSDLCKHIRRNHSEEGNISR